MTHGSLFSGVEGFGLGAAFAGIKTIWSCEFEEYQTKVIRKNFGEKHDINRDIRTYSKPPFADIISGGFPCQDISIAGKGVGITGERSGLWREMYRIVGEVRPRYVIIENSPMLLVRGLQSILCELAQIGYDAEWQCFSGTDFGIQQSRKRLYLIAYPRQIIRTRSSTETIFRKPYLSKQFTGVYPGWRTRRDIPEPRTFGKANELPYQLDRIECIGNAVQPIIAHYIFECIKEFDKNSNYLTI